MQMQDEILNDVVGRILGQWPQLRVLGLGSAGPSSVSFLGWALGPRRPGRSTLLCLVLPRTQSSRGLQPRGACCRTEPLGRTESPRAPFSLDACSLHHQLLCLMPFNLFPISVHLLLTPLCSFHFYITINLENQILCFAVVLCIHHVRSIILLVSLLFSYVVSSLCAVSKHRPLFYTSKQCRYVTSLGLAGSDLTDCANFTCPNQREQFHLWPESNQSDSEAAQCLTCYELRSLKYMPQ